LKALLAAAVAATCLLVAAPAASATESSPASCAAIGTSYATAPTEGLIAGPVETDCYMWSGESADRYEIRFLTGRGQARAPVRDGKGNLICWIGGSDSCEVSGSASWRVAVFDEETDTFSYSLTVRRLNEPAGCDPLGEPATWAFTAPRIDGSIQAALGAHCYTFSRAAGEEDGAYWFRSLRTAGTLQPSWRVYGPSGDQECSGGSWDYSPCRLLASGQYSLVIEDASRTGTGSYLLNAKRVTSPAGCSAVPSLAFGSAPVTGAISTGGEIDCHTVSAAAGDRVRISFAGDSGESRYVVVNGSGDSVCSQWQETCTLSGHEPWRVLVHGPGVDTFSYSLTVRRLNEPAGCDPLGEPATWAFTAPRIDGSIQAALGAHCYTFSRAAGEEDGAYWFRSLRTAGTLQPSWRVYGPSGDQECSGGSWDYSPCRLLASGQYSLVIEDASRTGTGSYLLNAKRVTSPAGCSEVASIAFGIPTVSGKIGTGGEIDCYLVKASAEDRLKFDLAGAADRLVVVSGSGDVACYWWNSCIVPEDEDLAILIYRSDAATGSYSLSATCENTPCGQAETAVADLFPKRLGAGDQVSTVLRGRDLELLEGASLVRGEQVVPADLQPVAPDGRSVELRFDLEGAALGTWELRAEFAGGTQRAVPGAAVIEAERPARMAVETVGRDAFRPGAPNRVTVELSNEGNVDGLGVPVVLAGIPEGAEVEPVFDVQDTVGPWGEGELQEGAFDQSEDTFVEEGQIVLPLIVARIPAGRTIQLDYEITVPTLTDYDLRTSVGQCLRNGLPESPSAALSGLTATRAASSSEVNCMGAIADLSLKQELLGAVGPGKQCAGALGGVGIDVFVDAEGGANVAKPDNFFSWLVGGSACVVEVVPYTKLLKIGKTATKILGRVDNALQGLDLVDTGITAFQGTQACLATGDSAKMQQRGVIAIDPNDIVGPTGSGAARYISGEDRMGYQVLFENLPGASAPAQRVKITDQLDVGTFDAESVLFREVAFGSTVFTLPYEGHEVEETIDLRPAQDLLVELTAEVSDGGEVSVVLQAIDPETLEPPEDPLVGFLPPNLTSPQGEGYLSFSAEPKSLPAGSTIVNKASIVFDGNEPIETPTWTNTVDKLPPTASLSATASSNPAAAAIEWSGSDDAAGISFYEVRVSRDGGPFVTWKTAAEPGSATFLADEPGVYSFRAVAHDGANNVGQSAATAIALAPALPALPSGPPAGAPAAGGGDAAASLAPAADKAPARPAPAARIARLQVDATKRRITAVFSAVGQGAGGGAFRFECKLDRGRLRPCRSPQTFSGLKPGKHKLTVVLVDATGHRSAAAVRRFALSLPPSRRASSPPERH
jgi:hypothetical protein